MVDCPFGEEEFYRLLRLSLQKEGIIWKSPIMGGKQLDLFRLFRVVLSMGGIEEVVRKK